MSRRTIDLGYGVAVTNLNPAQIARQRAGLIDSFTDQERFMHYYARFRDIAGRMSPMDLDRACDTATHEPIAEAAMIEALASLRAEGHRL